MDEQNRIVGWATFDHMDAQETLALIHEVLVNRALSDVLENALDRSDEDDYVAWALLRAALDRAGALVS